MLPNLASFSAERLRIAAKIRLYQEDQPLFFREQLKIKTKFMGLQPLALNPVQIQVYQALREQRRKTGRMWMYVSKPRQYGGSTEAAAMIWNKMSLNPYVRSFVVGYSRDNAARLFDIYDTFWRNMTPDIQPMRQYFTKGSEIVLGNPNLEDFRIDSGLQSSLLTAEAKNINVGVGETIHCLHLSEICRYPNPDMLGESLFDACSGAEDTIRIFESSAHFASGAAWFREGCERARHGGSRYGYVFGEWWRLPEYSLPLEPGEKLKLSADERMLVKKYGLPPERIKWRRFKIADDYKGDENLFRLSYPFTFEEQWITKESSTFPYDRLMELYQMIKPPLKRFEITEDGKMYEDPEGRLWIWIEPEPGKKYDIGADVAEGSEDGDFSAAEIIERGTNRQCAEWHGHVIPMIFAEILAAIGRYYNYAQIAPELTGGHGFSVVHRLSEIYHNIFIWRALDKLAAPITAKSPLGWETSHTSKVIIVDHCRQLMHHRNLQIYSERLWNEMHNFVRDYTDSGNVTFHAAPGHFDDLCMAYLIVLKISDLENFEKYYVRDEEINKPSRPQVEACYYDAVGLHNAGKPKWDLETGPWD